MRHASGMLTTGFKARSSTKAVVDMVTDAGRKYLYGYKFWTGFSDVAGKA